MFIINEKFLLFLQKVNYGINDVVIGSKERLFVWEELRLRFGKGVITRVECSFVYKFAEFYGMRRLILSIGFSF